MRWVVRAVPVLLILASLAAVFSPRGAETLPLFASRTGLLCQNCHFDPNGGGPRNEFGFAFARNRHSLEPEADSTSEWRDLNVVNRVGENFPLFFGVNQRVLLLANSANQSDSLDRLGFFNMENAIHIAFQPHRRLALVHTRDGGVAKESFGWIGGFPLDGYLKVGAFRNPFGLRLDDHTVATRNGFLDFYQGNAAYAQSIRPRFLPYDPRQTDTGLEVGGDVSGFYGRLALTNGNSFLFGGGVFGPNPFAETKAIKVGYHNAWYQSGLSFYDDFQNRPLPFAGVSKRATRWGYYGLLHQGPFVALGEIGAGTDDVVGFGKFNSLAGFAELNWHPTRALNFRGRWDYMDLDRDRTLVPGPHAVTRSELNTHQRYSIEGEVVPVPFAELRWSLRYIDHRAPRGPLDDAIEDERQAYLQAHFSY